MILSLLLTRDTNIRTLFYFLKQNSANILPCVETSLNFIDEKNVRSIILSRKKNRKSSDFLASSRELLIDWSNSQILYNVATNLLNEGKRSKKRNNNRSLEPFITSFDKKLRLHAWRDCCNESFDINEWLLDSYFSLTHELINSLSLLINYYIFIPILIITILIIIISITINYYYYVLFTVNLCIIYSPRRNFDPHFYANPSSRLALQVWYDTTDHKKQKMGRKNIVYKKRTHIDERTNEWTRNTHVLTTTRFFIYLLSLF